MTVRKALVATTARRGCAHLLVSPDMFESWSAGRNGAALFATRALTSGVLASKTATDRRDGTTALAQLWRHGVFLQPRGVRGGAQGARQ